VSVPGVSGAEVLEAAQSDDSMGFCLGCGAEAYGVEPDAERYKCESCEQRQVYGAEQLVLMGHADEEGGGS
jgi:hypothetical protein